MVQRVHKAATETMEMLGLPAAVLDESGMVLMANRLLEEAAFGLQWLSDGRIALESAKSQRLLRLAIADLARPGASGTRSIPVAATATHGACIVHLIPAAGSARDVFDGCHALLVVTPLAIGPMPLPALEGLFDLTPAEARVARRIALGHTMERIALDFEVSRETVRTHMKAIFSKTGMNKQAQVAALVAGLPRIPLCAAAAAPSQLPS
jgi:DNA-binding CsgD family transcriptional regulator